MYARDYKDCFRRYGGRQCAAKMEEAAKKVEGVKNAVVNFMLLKMNVEFEDGAEPAAVMENVRTACRKVESDCEIFLKK